MARREMRMLRERQRISYYEPEEPALDEYIFCEECADYVFEYCAIHGPLLVIPDNKVPYKPQTPAIVPRAALTIPRVFLHLARSIIPGAGIGVFSSMLLPRGVRFGPYRGQRSQSPHSPYCWQIYDRERRRAHVLDASDAQRSNWMRYVNCARHWTEQNLVAFQYQGELYYRTIKIIPRYTELLVFYGSEYANTLGVDLGAYNAPLGYAAKYGARVIKKSKLTVVEENPQQTALEDSKKDEKKKQKIIDNERMHKNDQPVIENKIINTMKVLKDISNVDNNEKKQITKTNLDTNTNRVDKKMSLSDKKIIKKNNQQKNQGTKEKLYRCVHCQKYFSYKCNLKTHMRLHTGEKPYKCDICQKCFTRKGSLATHLRVHTGEKPYKCDICQKCFTRKGSLATHLRVHTGEKPYKCDICQKCFTQKGSLATHLRVHAGEKPYQCDICQKCFTTKNHLKEHLRIHTGEKPYKCDICQKCFTQKGSLTTHLRIHIGDKPYQCDISQKCFTQKSNLKRHVKTH